MSLRTTPADRFVVALDTSDWDEFAAWCRLFGPRVGVLKVGLEAFARWGPAAVEKARCHAASVFLDLKLHDIPNTVAGAVGAARDLGVDYITAHAAGGQEMLRAAAEAGGDRTTILAVTVLTHLDRAALQRLGITREPGLLARAWADQARSAGCRGAVCSVLELGEPGSLREHLKAPFELVTPGIRPQALAGDDQRRTATPSQALARGADLLVVGRPLTRASDPQAALESLLLEVEENRADGALKHEHRTIDHDVEGPIMSGDH